MPEPGASGEAGATRRCVASHAVGQRASQTWPALLRSLPRRAKQMLEGAPSSPPNPRGLWICQTRAAGKRLQARRHRQHSLASAPKVSRASTFRAKQAGARGTPQFGVACLWPLALSQLPSCLQNLAGVSESLCQTDLKLPCLFVLKKYITSAGSKTLELALPGWVHRLTLAVCRAASWCAGERAAPEATPGVLHAQRGWCTRQHVAGISTRHSRAAARTGLAGQQALCRQTP